MLFSVVIPLYNKSSTITRTIQSVLHQTCQDFEIVVVDDGSTDGSGEIVRELNDPRIRLIQQANAGVSAARNRGIAEAQNAYIAFPDADDEWMPDFLATMKILIANFPQCGAYATSYRIVSAPGKIFFPEIDCVPPAPWIGIIPNYFDMSLRWHPFITSSIVIPGVIFQTVGGFPVGIKWGEDLDLFIRIALRYPIAYTSNYQTIYHLEAENRSSKKYTPGLGASYFPLLEEALRDDAIATAMKKSIVEYMAHRKITLAAIALLNEDPRQARAILKTCPVTKKSWGRRLRMRLLAWLPLKLFRLLRNDSGNTW